MDDNSQELLKGQPTEVGVRFIRNGTAVVFQAPPKWNLFNSTDAIIQTGTAQTGSGSGSWVAQITVPADYVPASGLEYEDLTLEVFGTDVNRKERSTEKELRLVDFNDDFLPDGLIWFKGQETVDTLVSNQPIISLTAVIQNAAGEAVVVAEAAALLGSSRQVRNRSDVPDRFNTGVRPLTSYHSDVSLGVLDLPESTVPYLIYYTITTAAGTEHVVHQLYWTNNRMINLSMRMRSYLDKARLTEIDPTLQWMDNELFAAAYEGLQYINAFPPEITYWKFSELPQSFDLNWMYAGALHLLNTRYLAEGMTKFDFTGLNTTLNVDRQESLAYKIDELKDFLSKMEATKKSAIRNEGKGSADPTAGLTNGRGFVAMLGLSINPTNNAARLRGSQAMRRFRPY